MAPVAEINMTSSGSSYRRHLAVFLNKISRKEMERKRNPTKNKQNMNTACTMVTFNLTVY